MIALDDEEVRRLVTFPELVDAMRSVFVAAANGDTVCPPRCALNVPGGWFAAMPASVSFDGVVGLGAKLITAFPSNAAADLPTHLATILLFDPTTGFPIASIAANWLTDMRTAAVSVVATAALSGPGPSAHAILGSGALARSHLHGFAEQGMISRCYLWARSPEKAKTIHDEAKSLGIAAEVCADPNEAVARADVITTVTGSTEPLFEVSAIKAGAHINAVGACVPTRRELPAALLARASIFVDSRAGAVTEAGDIVLAIADGAIGPQSIKGELGEVVSGSVPGRSSPAEITIFESLGLAIEDVAAASLVFGRARH